MIVLPVKGRFKLQHFRKSKLINEFEFDNGVTVEGKNFLLNEMFPHSGYTPSNPATWYMGLIDNSGSPVLAETDTLVSHTGWTEFTAYSGTRKAWVPAAAASKVKGTTTVSSFVLTASATVYGAFICSVTSGTSGILFNTGAFENPSAFNTSDEIKLGYVVRLT